MPTYTRTGEGPASATDLYGHQVEVAPGDSVETYKILSTGWTKTSDEPYYRFGTAKDPTASPGSISGLKGFKILQISTDGSNIVIFANSASNPYGYPLAPDSPFYVENSGEIDEVHFTGSGTVSIVGLYK